MTSYIWQNENWPHFTYDKSLLTSILSSLNLKIASYENAIREIDKESRKEVLIDTLVSEIVDSFKIEEISLPPLKVKECILNYINGKEGKSHIDKIVYEYISLLKNPSLPLTKEKLCKINKEFNKEKEEGYRKDDVYIISQKRKETVIHYEAPPTIRIEKEIESFIKWFNKDSFCEDMFIKSAITHLYFVSIHPFNDGNGRTTRLLSLIPLSSIPFLNISSAIYKKRKDYYEQLEMCEKGNLNITSWIRWYISIIEECVDIAISNIEIIEKKNRVLKDEKLNENMKKIVLLLLKGFKGKLNKSKYEKICKTTSLEANKELEELSNLGYLQRENDNYALTL